MTREGQREYRYGGMDKVVSVLEAGRTVAEFAYGADGQLASIERKNGENERLWWSGLALTRRDYLDGDKTVSSERYLNEPHPGGGNPVLVWEGKTSAAPASAKERAKEAATRLLFTDMLGSTVSVIDGDRAEATNMTLFGETPDGQGVGFFTGKPHVDELGYAFLFRNYRPEKAKWQTADPLGYPDGWNALAYCGNNVCCFDYLGCWTADEVSKYLTEDNLKDLRSLDNVYAYKGYVQLPDGTRVTPNGFFKPISDNYSYNDIYLLKDLSDVECAATIIHELTHYHQYLRRGKEPVKTQDEYVQNEVEAYTNDYVFRKQHGLPFTFDGVTDGNGNLVKEKLESAIRVKYAKVLAGHKLQIDGKYPIMFALPE